MTERAKGGRWDGPWVAGWMAAGLALRALLAGFTNRITGDGVGWYIPMARAFVEGRLDRGFDAYIPPVYSLSTAAIAKLLPAGAWAGPAGEAGALELAGQIASTLYGVATIPLVYLLVRALAPASHARVLARTAAALAAVSPFLARYSARVMSESAYTLFFVLALLAGLRLLTRRTAASSALFGFAVGVACLNRPEGMALLGIIGAWIGIPALWNRKGLARALGLGIVAGVFFLAGLFPQMAVTHARTGVWTLSAKGGQIFRSGLTTDPLAREKWLYPSPGARSPAGSAGSKRAYDEFKPDAVVKSDPLGFAKATVVRLVKLLAHVPQVLGVVLSCFALAGIFGRREIPRWDRERVAASIPAAYLLLLSFFRPAERFLIPLVPLGLLWSAMGVVEIAGRVRRGEWTRLAARLPERARRNTLAWSLGAAVLLTLPEALDPLRQGGFRWYWSPEKEVGVWMRAHLGPAPKIMTRGSYIEAYYAGARVAYFPFAPYDEVMRYVGRTEVRYILLDEKTRRLRPGFLERLAEEPRARLVRRFEIGKDTEVLYEVLPGARP